MARAPSACIPSIPLCGRKADRLFRQRNTDAVSTRPKRINVIRTVFKRLFTGNDHSALHHGDHRAIQTGFLFITNAVLIGVNHDRNTFIHSVDEHVALPDRVGTTPYDITIIDHQGTVLQHPMYPHLCSKTEDVSIYYVNFDKPLAEMGAQTMGTFGNAQVRIVDAKACREVIARIYTRAPQDLFTEYRVLPETLYR